jgi:phosphatidylserine/phosphatidylglycerophosphate/cardiolipin synthase-like enzyme
VPRRVPDLFAAFATITCLACMPPPSLPARSRSADPSGRAPQSLELVESWPLETSLDHADVRDAKDVWPELIDAARVRLDFAEFYASDDPKAATALTPIVSAVERAAARGVKVRWLADAKLAKTYPELLDRFSHAGVDVRRFDVAKTMGGVLHAKYFVADDVAYIGSQNFDWRSLEHIQELGLRIAIPEVVHALAEVFELDWATAGGVTTRSARSDAGAPNAFPVHTDMGRVSFVASPKGSLPDESLWELPALVKLIDSATQSVRVQLLTYRAHGGREGEFPDLEAALKRAAARGVKVELLVSDWSKRKGTVEGLQALVAPSLEVKVLDVPAHSSGFIPFARVAHAKYLVVDGSRAWVGTSNWERDYFFASRNVGVIVEGGAIPPRLDAFFVGNWSSAYAETLDPTRAYTAPRVGE